MATVALHMIVKDELDSVRELVKQALPYFDKLIIVISDHDKANEFHKENHDNKKILVKYRKWNDNFADARNYAMGFDKCDYFFWIDADDEFDFSNIPKLVSLAESGKYDAIYLPYNYAQDDHGNTTTIHDRERLVRRSKGFEWRGAVHESLLCDDQFRGKKLSQPEVIHHAGNVKASMVRNHNILVKAVLGQENPDPRNMYYLGISYFGIGEYEKAINMLNDYTRVGGWNEEIYRAFLKIAECYYMMDKYADAMQEALKAAGILPSYPDAYLALARFEYGQDNWAECLEWIQVAFSKPQPDTMSVRNPEMYEYAKLYSAVCHYELKHYQTAYKHLKAAPEYLAKELLENFKEAANLEVFITLLPELTKYIKEHDLWNVLPDSIKYDNRVREMRYRNIEPKKWLKKSIVYFCGKGYEPWGANTLDKGMGGSEEAVVYLSRELAQLGYDVTVYNETAEAYEDSERGIHSKPDSMDLKLYNGGKVSAVHYKPWREFDPRDEFDNLIIWRAPDYAKQLVKQGIKANRILIDVHDVLSRDYVTDIPGVTYMVKSQYHRNLYSYLPDDKFVIVGNGIKVDQFDNSIPKSNSVGYFSAYYRGLETLLKLWPRIRGQVPDAELNVAYGWNSWVELEGENDFYVRVSKMLKDLEDHGVVHHNRLSHVDLAKLMSSTQVWAYPTEFSEIHCITALKAQQAGCYPVTTNVAALNETVQSGVKLDTRVIYTDEYQQKRFVDEVVKALKDAKTGTPVSGVDWSDVAKVWDKTLRGK